MFRRNKTKIKNRIKPKPFRGTSFQPRSFIGKPNLKEPDDYVKKQNFKNLISQKDREINELEISLENKEEIISKQGSEIRKLIKIKKDCEEHTEEYNKAKESLEEIKDELKTLKQSQKEKTEEFKTKISEKDEEIGERKKNNNNLLEKYKTLLCSEELLNDLSLKEEKSHFLEKLWGQTIKRGIKRESPKELEKPKVLNFEDYKKSEKCVCGKSKKFSSKGCPICKKVAEKYNKRDKGGMEKSWAKVWKKYGIVME